MALKEENVRFDNSDFFFFSSRRLLNAIYFPSCLVIIILFFYTLTRVRHRVTFYNNIVLRKAMTKMNINKTKRKFDRFQTIRNRIIVNRTVER